MADLATQTFSKLTETLSSFIAQLVNALISVVVIAVFLVLGYFVAWVVNQVIIRVFEQIEVEKRIRRQKLDRVLLGFTLTGITTALVKIFVVLAFLGTATEVVNLGLFTDLIKLAVIYVPTLIQGVAILVVGLLFSDYIARLIKRSSSMPITNMVAAVVQLFVAYIALVIALPLILPGVKVAILERAFELFIGAAAVAIGFGLAIAFGLGLKDSIAAAAKKNQRVFDNFFGQIKEQKK
ncbi:MAG: hypothetical protein J4432_05150 [DPANN group archaeon]|nr:hypothetical protein [DPANN group archaeon]